jgi:hypothetical protein
VICDDRERGHSPDRAGPAVATPFGSAVMRAPLVTTSLVLPSFPVSSWSSGQLWRCRRDCGCGIAG